MSDVIIHENLLLIFESIDVINKRFSSINKPDDLVMNDYGVTILDAIAMRLQIIGELLKKIDHEIIFDICANHLPKLRKAIQKMLA